MTWRLPCGGDEYFNDGTVPQARWTYEWDDRGHPTYRLQELPGGAYFAEETVQYEGDIAVRDSGQRLDGVSYTWQGVVEDGHYVSTTYSDDRGGNDYSDVWTWSGDDLTAIDRDYGPGGHLVMSFTPEAAGFVETDCNDRASTCDVTTLAPADHVGDWSHWTHLESDQYGDGVIEEVDDRVFDSHDLPLTHDRAMSGTATLHEEWTREADGTATRYLTQDAPPTGDRVRIEYDFQCP